MLAYLAFMCFLLNNVVGFELGASIAPRDRITSAPYYVARRAISWIHSLEIGWSSKISPLRRVVLPPPLTRGSDESQDKDKGQNPGAGWTPDAGMISHPMSRQGTEPARKFNARGFSAVSVGAASAIRLPRDSTLGLLLFRCRKEPLRSLLYYSHLRQSLL